MFEHNGRLSVLPKAEKRPVTPEDVCVTVKAAHIGVEVVMDGRAMSENLLRMGRDERWLQKRLSEQGYACVKDVFLGIYHPEEDTLRVYPNG